MTLQKIAFYGLLCFATFMAAMVILDQFDTIIAQKYTIERLTLERDMARQDLGACQGNFR